MTIDLKFGHNVVTIDLVKVMKFQNFISSSTKDMDIQSVPGVQNDPVGPSSVNVPNGDHIIFKTLNCVCRDSCV